MHQVRLPEPGAAPNEERVVGRRRGYGDPVGGGGGEFVAAAHDEPLERVALVEQGGGREVGTSGIRREDRREVVDGRLREIGELDPLLRTAVFKAKAQLRAEFAFGDLSQQVAVLILHPLDGELRRGGDHEGVVGERDSLRGSQPCAIRLLGQHDLRGRADLDPSLVCGQLHRGAPAKTKRWDRDAHVRPTCGGVSNTRHGAGRALAAAAFSRRDGAGAARL